jgi:hypothetical protein
MSGQKVRNKNFDPSLKSKTNYELTKAIAQKNQNLKKPKIHFLNKWNDMSNKSSKYSKMLMTDKILRNEEKFIRRICMGNSGLENSRANSVYRSRVAPSSGSAHLSSTLGNRAFSLDAIESSFLESSEKSQILGKKFSLRNGRKLPDPKMRTKLRRLLKKSSQFSLNRSMRIEDNTQKEKERYFSEYRRKKDRYFDKIFEKEKVAKLRKMKQLLNTKKKGKKQKKVCFDDISEVLETDRPQSGPDFERLSQVSQVSQKSIIG